MQSSLSNEEIVRLGIGAEQLLQQEVTQNVFEYVANDIRDNMLATEPDERDQREHLYVLHNALSLVYEEFQKLIAAKDEVQRRLEADQLEQQEELSFEDDGDPLEDF